MNTRISPAIALLQQLEALLKDPARGPRTARQVAAVVESMASDRTLCRQDADAYARLWTPVEDDRSGQQAWISLASI